MSEESESISPEEYGTLMEKLTEVTSALEKQTSEVTDLAEKYDTISAKVEEIEKGAEPESTPSQDEVIAKAVKEAVEPLTKKIEELEKMPLVKGIQDATAGTAEEEPADIIGNTIKAAYVREI